MRKVLLSISRILFIIGFSAIVQSCTDTLDEIKENTAPVLETETIVNNNSIEANELLLKASLPKVLVSCANPCVYNPLTVTFTSPNYAKIGNRGPIYDAIITPLFVTEDDKFQVFARIEHGACASKHTVVITNCANYTETIYSGSCFGTIDYRGYIPLARKSDTERIAIQLFNY